MGGGAGAACVPRDLGVPLSSQLTHPPRKPLLEPLPGTGRSGHRSAETRPGRGCVLPAGTAPVTEVTTLGRAGSCQLPHGHTPTDSPGRPPRGPGQSPHVHIGCALGRYWVPGPGPAPNRRGSVLEGCAVTSVLWGSLEHRDIKQCPRATAGWHRGPGLLPSPHRLPASCTSHPQPGQWDSGDRPGARREGGQPCTRGIGRRPEAGHSGAASPRRIPLWPRPRESFRNPGPGGRASERLPGSGKLSTDPKDFLGPELRPERKYPNYPAARLSGPRG